MIRSSAKRRFRLRGGSEHDIEHLLPVQPDDREDRPELDHLGEHTVRIVVSEQAFADEEGQSTKSAGTR